VDLPGDFSKGPQSTQNPTKVAGVPSENQGDVYRTPQAQKRQPSNPFGTIDDYAATPTPQTQLPSTQNQTDVVLPNRQRPAVSGQQDASLQAPSFADRLSFFLSQTLGTIQDDGKTKIGVLLPLSGQHEGLGKALLNAGLLATKELAPADYNLMPFDTKGTTRGARDAARDAVAANVDLIIGPLFSKNAEAASSVVRSAGVNMVSLTNDRGAAARGIYVMGHAPEPQITYIVSYAQSQGIQKVAAMIPNSAYGNITYEVLRRVMSYYNLDLVQVERYNPKDDLRPAVKALANYEDRQKNLEDEIERVQEIQSYFPEDSDDYQIFVDILKQMESLDTWGDFPYEAVLIVEGGDTLRSLVPLLAYYDLDQEHVQRLGIGRWEEIKPWQDPTFRGAWVAAPDPAYRLNFEKRYVGIFGAQPPRIATLVYDAVALSSVLAKQQNPDFSRDAIIQPNGFVGVDGIFRFKPNYTVERGLAILEVTSRGLKPIVPAPSTFKVAVPTN